MKRFLMLAFILLVGLANAQNPIVLADQSLDKATPQIPPSVTHRLFPADTVKQLIQQLTKELSLNHPGFYRYTTKEEFTQYIDSLTATIQDSLSEFAVYGKLKPLMAKIHCLHTGIALSNEDNAFLNQQANLLPFQLYFVDTKAFVVKNYSDDQSILSGDEVLSINGRSIAKIKEELFSFIPSDCYNLTLKYRALFYQFPTWYRLIDPTETFTLVTKQKGILKSCQLKGTTFDSLARDGFLREPSPAKQLAFTIEGNVGILTIHSFAQTAIKRGKQDFKAFIDQAFKAIKQGKIQNLIVDLRNNTGGTDPNAAYFTRYFFNQPFRYWDRIEVTERFSKQIKGLVLKTFYKKPIQQDGVWIWPGARHTKAFDFYQQQRPAKNAYRGKAYILINGFCMSSCGDVAAVLSSNKKAVFIGEETGGGYQGNTSGMLVTAKVAPFSFKISLPLQKYVNHVHPVEPIGRGTMPDYPIGESVNDLQGGLDRPLLFTLDLIKKGL